MALLVALASMAVRADEPPDDETALLRPEDETAAQHHGGDGALYIRLSRLKGDRL